MRYIVLVGLCMFGVVHSQAHAATKTLPSQLIKKLQSRLETAHKNGQLAGTSVGVVYKGKLVWQWHKKPKGTKGSNPNANTYYRIGSISKVLTTSLLAQMWQRGEVTPDTPVSTTLPKAVKLPSKPGGWPYMTFHHLATHTSGLASMPANITPKKGDPYNGYTKKQLFSGIPYEKLVLPIGRKYMYSNLGMGLLGVALAQKANRNYEALVKERILHPLGMNNTFMTPQKRYIPQGFAGPQCRVPTTPWNFGALAPAGGWISNLNDLAKFVSFQMKKDAKSPLTSATLREMQRIRQVIGISNGRIIGGIGLGWTIFPVQGTKARLVMHNGKVSGSYGFVGFSPETQVGLIMLSHCTQSRDKIAVTALNSMIRQLSGAKKQAPVATNTSQRAFFKRFCGLFKQQVTQKEIQALYHKAFLSQIPATKLQKLFGFFAKKYGTCIASRIFRRPQPNRWIVGFQFKKHYRTGLLIQLSSTPTPQVVLMKFLMRPQKIPGTPKAATSRPTTKP